MIPLKLASCRRYCPLLLVLVTACAPNHLGADLIYTVDVTPRRSDLEVTLKLTRITRPTLALVGCAAKGVLQVSDFAVTDEKGAPVEFSASIDTVESRGERIPIPRYVVRNVAAGATVRYRATLGAREGNTHFGFTGRCFSYKGPAFGFATGRQIFLVPENAGLIRTIAVQVLTAKGLRVATPWPRKGSGWAPCLPGADPRDPLVSATIAWGHLQERVIPMGTTKLRLTYEGAEAELSDQDVAVVQRCARFVRELFGRDLGPDYSVLLAGTTPDGDELVGEGWGTGQGGTLLPISGRTMRTFSERLIDAYVLHPPYRATIRDPKQYWLIDAVRTWYAWRAVEAAGLVDEAQIDGDLAQAYYAAFDLRDVGRNLESLYAAAVPNPIAQGGVAPVVLRYLDWRLRNETPSARGVDALIPRLFDPHGNAGLWDLLPRGNASWSQFRRDFVQGLDVVPVSQLSQVSPTRPHPTVHPGESRKRLTLLYTGNAQGYLETCGCKVNQSGGIARRATVLQRARAVDAEAIVLDAGNLFARMKGPNVPDALARSEQRFFLQMMDEMRYQAASVGSVDLEYGVHELAAQVDKLRTPFLGANIETRQSWSPLPFVVLRAHGLRVGVVGVLEPPTGDGATVALDHVLRTVVVRDPITTVARIAASLRSRVDLLVILGELRPVTIRRLIRTRPDIDIIISTSDEAPIGTWDARAKQLRVERHDKSGFVEGTLVLYTSLNQYGVHKVLLDVGADLKIVGADVEEIWLREDVPDDPRVRDELSGFYESVARGAGANSEVRGPLAGVAWKAGRLYVGASRCASCHSAEYAQWKTTAHASAYKTLLDRHRQVQPRCVSCHVVGYGESTGYRFGDKEEPLGNVQCEVCHGPGGEHVADPARSNIARAVPEQICLPCHNEEHSEAFVYADRIGEVNHTRGPAGTGIVSSK